MLHVLLWVYRPVYLCIPSADVVLSVSTRMVCFKNDLPPEVGCSHLGSFMA